MLEPASPISFDSATGKPELAGILLVEDSEHTRRPLADLLRFRGHTVHEATHGREALDVLERHPNAIRLILLDLAMPVMDGWQFRQAAKNVAIQSSFEHLPLTPGPSPQRREL